MLADILNSHSFLFISVDIIKFKNVLEWDILSNWGLSTNRQCKIKICLNKNKRLLMNVLSGGSKKIFISSWYLCI